MENEFIKLLGNLSKEEIEYLEKAQQNEQSYKNLLSFLRHTTHEIK